MISTFAIEPYANPYSSYTMPSYASSGYYGGDVGMMPAQDMNYYHQSGYYNNRRSIFEEFMPDQIVLEPYIYLHYNLSAATYSASGGPSYDSIYNKTIPGGFGGAIGLRMNNIFLAEFDITGARDKTDFAFNGQSYSQSTNFVFLRFNLGIAIPLSRRERMRGRTILEEILMSQYDRRVNILVLGGFTTLIRDVTFSPSIPPETIGTTIGVLPEVGGGVEYWFNHRFGLRTSIRYAFAGTDPVVKGLLTFDIGVQFKL